MAKFIDIYSTKTEREKICDDVESFKRRGCCNQDYVNRNEVIVHNTKINFSNWGTFNFNFFYLFEVIVNRIYVTI